jgi:hypothetical protein
MALYQGSLADPVRVLGADHSNTLRSGDSLATAHDSAGHLDTPSQ